MPTQEMPNSILKSPHADENPHLVVNYSVTQ